MGCRTRTQRDEFGAPGTRIEPAKMAAALRDVINAQKRHRAIVQNVGSVFQIYFTDREAITDYRDFCTHVDRNKFRLFANALLQSGIYMSPANTLHSLSSLAHSDADIRATAEAVARTLETL